MCEERRNKSKQKEEKVVNLKQKQKNKIKGAKAVAHCEHGGCTFLPNVGNHLSDYTASRTRRH
jgi:hypothetical protein